MQPVVCLTYPADTAGNDESFARTFPLLTPSHTLAPFPEKTGRNQVDLWIPDPAFPYLWVFIETWCRQLLSNQSYLRIIGEQNPDPGMVRECSQWIRRARSQARFARTTADVVDEFWRWVRALDERRKAALPGVAIAAYGLRIANGTATWLDRIRLRFLLSRPALAWRRALQTIPQQAQAIASGQVAEASFLRWLEENVPHIGGTDRLNQITRSTLKVITNLTLAHDAETARAIPPAAVECNRSLHRPIARRRHQMFGHRQELYEWLPNQPVNPCVRTHHLLMQISSSDGMDWTWGDLGEIYFWITDDDLRQQRFDRVLSRIEGA